MKFDSSAIPTLPTQQEMTELNDLLLSAMELYKIYRALEGHPRVVASDKSVDIFTSCKEQLHEDIALMDKQLETLLTLSRSKSDELPPFVAEKATSAHSVGTESHDPFLLIPDVEPTDMKQSVFELMRKAFQNEDIFKHQLQGCLSSAQFRKHLKLELQLKMIILSASQRCKLLEERYGFARTKNALFQGLRRQTTRFLSALNGERRIDIDK